MEKERNDKRNSTPHSGSIPPSSTRFSEMQYLQSMSTSLSAHNAIQAPLGLKVIKKVCFQGAIAKWLRRQIRNLFLFEGAGSNPAGVGVFFIIIPSCFVERSGGKRGRRKGGTERTWHSAVVERTRPCKCDHVNNVTETVLL